MLFDIKVEYKGNMQYWESCSITHSTAGRDNSENKTRHRSTQERQDVVYRPHFKLLITPSSKTCSIPAVTKHDRDALLMSFNESFIWAANF